MSTAGLRALSLLSFAVMVAALVLLVLSRSLFSAALPVVVVQCAAFGLMVWARITFGRRSFHAGADPTAGDLVTAGPYRWIRHPIYTAIILFGGAGVIAHWSLLAALLGGLLFLGALARMSCEERLLAERFPEYREYARKTARMLPGLF